jgi:hypothetical protein
LVLSVGALALSVVAMTTMFIFVYSHGGRALEASVARPEPAALPAPLTSREPAAPGASAPPLLAGELRQCDGRGDPLAPASLRDPSAAQRGLEVEIRALRGSGSEPHSFASKALNEALPCE